MEKKITIKRRQTERRWFIPWHQARMLLPRAAKQLWLRCLLGKLGDSMQTEQATLSPPLLAGGIRSSKPISPALNPAFSPVPLAGTTWLKLCSVSHPKLWKEGQDSQWLEQDLQSTQPRWWMQQEVLKGKEKKTICSAEHQRQILLRPSHWFHTFSRS